MHEWGITETIIKEIIKQAQENHLKKVDKVCLSLGKESDITPETLEFCFQCLAKETISAGAKLEIKRSEGQGITLDSLEGSR
jgi:Zn finger protein HypA/HybF involved in hydrogenase expression